MPNNCDLDTPLVPVSNRLDKRIRLGTSELFVSRIGLGCWPMAGISSVGISDDDSISTVQTALDQGINFFDTAYAYGYDGRSDNVLRIALENRRHEAVIAHKVGTNWNSERQRCIDGRPATLLDQAAKCLARLNTDYVDVIYLHAPDPNVPIEESAGAIAEICNRGWARYAGVSNVDTEQAKRFHAECKVVAIQPYFNMFQQEMVQGLLQFAHSQQISMVCYWILMKGLLSGNLRREHVFDPADRRLTYPIFQGEAWQRAQNLLDKLRALASDLGCTITQLVTAWSLNAPGVTVALVGAKRPAQMIESAKALDLRLEPEIVYRINRWIAA